MAISPSVVPAIVLLPSEMVGGAPQSITGIIRIGINTELALVYTYCSGNRRRGATAEWRLICIGYTTPTRRISDLYHVTAAL